MVLVATVGWAVVAVMAVKPPRSRAHVVRASILGAFAGLAPIAAVVFLRLSVNACVVANILGLPTAEPWSEIARWGGGAVWLAATVMIVVALAVPRYRRAGFAMLAWSALVAVPTALLCFFMLYGDPGEGCVPA